MNVKAKLSLVLIFIAAFGMSACFAAGPDAIELFVSQSKVLKFDGLARLAVGDPEIADVNVFPETLDEAIINGKKPGVTTLNVWRATEAEPLSFEVRVSNNSSELENRTYPLKHYKLALTEYNDSLSRIEIKPDAAGVENLRVMLTPILGEKHFSLDIHRNTVLMQGAARDLDAAIFFLDEIDRPLKQVLIEAKVIEISKDDLKRLGNSLVAQKGRNRLTSTLSGASDSFNFAFDTFTDLARRFSITVDTLRTENVGRTLVNPKIAVLDGKTGWILAGEKFPIATRDNEQGLVSYSYVSTGIILAVTPRIGHDGSITLWLKPEVSSISGWVGDPNSSSQNAAPIIDTREVMSEVRVKDGESILIGGLHRDEEIVSRSRVPVLGKVPLIGSLFKKKRTSTRTSELVVVITPHIIEGNQPPDLDAMMGYIDLSSGSGPAVAKNDKSKGPENMEKKKTEMSGSPWTTHN